MANIGNLKKNSDGVFIGRIDTVAFSNVVALRPVISQNEAAPKYEVMALTPAILGLGVLAMGSPAQADEVSELKAQLKVLQQRFEDLENRPAEPQVVTATGFAQPLRVMFAPLYRLRQRATPAALVAALHRGWLGAFCRRLAFIELAVLLVVAFA